jgi:hypothetical protein
LKKLTPHLYSLSGSLATGHFMPIRADGNPFYSPSYKLVYNPTIDYRYLQITNENIENHTPKRFLYKTRPVTNLGGTT